MSEVKKGLLIIAYAFFLYLIFVGAIYLDYPDGKWYQILLMAILPWGFAFALTANSFIPAERKEK